ncbi:hypothetical protein [Rhodococcus sp. HNM0569]|uniref:hypothetical protein n=1 Tax=Rhodococcus sp. HNM0569 TaxID=2716340 RepID=UPI00146D7492|nr:hypothetical protein [Rhodococcus sp. HNM0569]NLU81301.1 hypothetical protein [Rhodococcus sp. HNM0569]
MTPPPVASRLVAAAAMTGLPLVALVVARVVAGDRVPGTLAVHWSGTRPDRFTAATTMFWTCLGIALVATAASVLVAASAARPCTGRRRPDAALWMPGAALVSWLSATVWIMSAIVTARASAPEDARMSAWIVLPLLAFAWAGAVYALLPRTAMPDSAGADVPTLDRPLQPGERASWLARAGSPWALGGAAVLTAAAVAAALLGQWWVAAPLLVIALVGTAFSSVTVRVDRAGLSLSSWGVRWRRIPLDDISSADVIAIVPVQWGGWGYRWTPRGTAVVLRGGDALAVHRFSTGRLFAVTVDAPEGGAALLNALAAARDSGTRQ